MTDDTAPHDTAPRDTAPDGTGQGPPTGRAVLALIAPTCVWAVHFVALYALVSAACAPRALLSPGAVALLGGAATALAVLLALLPLRVGGPLARATAVVAGISAAAILADAGILILFDSCGG
jgi:hypothetical protein